MVFDSEAAFEEAVIDGLKSYGWDDAGGVLRYPTEQDLIDNWASILYENNKHRDCLNNVPLTATEMQQIIEQVVAKRTPVAINELINGKEIVIKRDNPGDKLHEGRDVALKIFHRDEIAGGSILQEKTADKFGEAAIARKALGSNRYQFYVSDKADKFIRFANSIIKYGILSAKTVNIEAY